jgi:hypothetical protein
VDLEQIAQLGVGRLLGCSDMHAPGVVDQHVDPAMPGDDAPDRRVDGASVGHVQGQHVGLAGVRGRQVIQCRDLAGGRDGDIPGSDGRLRDCPAEPAVRPGDEPDPVHQELP